MQYKVRVKPIYSVIFRGVLYEPPVEYSVIVNEKELEYFRTVFNILKETPIKNDDEKPAVDNQLPTASTEGSVAEEVAEKRKRGRPSTKTV